MTGSRPPSSSRPDWRRRGDVKQEVRAALAALSQSERLDALRDVPISRSVKLGGPSRIALNAREIGILDEVLEAIRSYQRS